ncbi:hypothetical protein H6770_01040 [Candidatus Peribacteria bacterium]|nr:hypothetical protein [Candidatus Peribacteria bacterium]
MNLREFVTMIRAELEAADNDRRREGTSALFNLSTMELEVQIALTESNSDQGGLSMKVLTADTTDTKQTAVAHTVRLRYDVHRAATTGNRPGTKLHSSSPPDSGHDDGDVIR